MIIDFEMVLKELLRPSNLFGAQAFHIYELKKVIVIFQNQNFVFVAFEVVPPSLEGFNNGEELAIMSFLSSFY